MQEDTRDLDSIPGSGRPAGVGNDNYTVWLPGKFRGKRSLQATVHGVAKSHARLSVHTHRQETPM